MSRKDVMERKRLQKGKEYQVIKCSLGSCTSGSTGKTLGSEIEKLVIVVSQLHNKMALVCNRLVLHCLSANKPLPELSQTLFFQCAVIGTSTIKKPISILQEVWYKYFPNYPKITRYKGDGSAVSNLAKSYLTNFKTQLKTTFEKRQAKFIKRWCIENSFDKEVRKSIVYKINGWKGHELIELPHVANEFMELNRTKLQIEDGTSIDETWLETHLHKLIDYNYFILGFFETWGIKGFNLAPMVKPGRRFVTIDTTQLWNLLRNANLIAKKMTVKEALHTKRTQLWELFFQGRRFENNQVETLQDLLRPLSRGTFESQVDTDGVSIGVCFSKPKKDKQRKEYPHIPKETPVIGIDPGRRTILYATKKYGNKYTHFQLTRKSYYCWSGIDKSRKKEDRWKNQLSEVYEEQSLTTTKTTNPEKFNEFLRIYLKHYQTIWKHTTQKKMARERFGLYMGKRKVLDQFLSSLKEKDEPESVVAFGAAKICSTGKNETSIPTTSVSRRCSNHYKTILVDEYNTTKICNRCHQKTSKVMDRKSLNLVTAKITQYPIRGLRRCNSNEDICRPKTLLHRDKNASINILNCFLAGSERPQAFRRKSSNSLGLPLI
jgi:hypothetical protein